MSTPTARRRHTSEGDDFITALLGTWLIAGLFIDGYAHSEIIDGTEGFITPWHGVFYSGFLAVAAWIGRLIYCRLEPGRPLISAVPKGYELAPIGLAIFAAGGVGDGIWHTLYGVETSLDALLSPTHLLLYTGMLIVVSTPFRAASARAGDRGTWGGFRVPFVSALLSTALTAFFFLYLWAPSEPFWFRQSYDPVTDSGDVFVTAGMGAVIVSTAVLIAPVIVVLRRWTPPFGFVAVLWPVVNGLVAVAFDQDLVGVPAGIAGGLAADIAIVALRSRPGRVTSAVVGFVAPVVMWSVFFYLIGAEERLQWQPELWGGAIFFSGLTGVSLAWLATLPVPTAERADTRTGSLSSS